MADLLRAYFPEGDRVEKPLRIRKITNVKYARWDRRGSGSPWCLAFTPFELEQKPMRTDQLWLRLAFSPAWAKSTVLDYLIGARNHTRLSHSYFRTSFMRQEFIRNRMSGLPHGHVSHYRTYRGTARGREMVAALLKGFEYE